MSLHTRAENPEYDTTEWAEVQKKHGNWGETGPDFLAAKLEEEERERDEQRQREEEKEDDEWEKHALADDLDLVDEEEEKLMAQFREQRLEELKAERKATHKFGHLKSITADSFRTEVTDAAADELCVVVHLFKDGREDCAVVDRLLERLASLNPQTKFTRILFSNAIPDYPESNLPTILVYKQHDIALQILTTAPLGGLELLAGRFGEQIMTQALGRCGAVKDDRAGGGDGDREDAVQEARRRERIDEEEEEEDSE